MDTFLNMFHYVYLVALAFLVGFVLFNFQKHLDTIFQVPLMMLKKLRGAHSNCGGGFGGQEMQKNQKGF